MCSDPSLLWLWLRPAAAAVIQPLAWEPPYTTGVALKRQNPKKKKKEFDQIMHDLYQAVSEVSATPKFM